MSEDNWWDAEFDDYHGTTGRGGDDKPAPKASPAMKSKTPTGPLPPAIHPPPPPPASLEYLNNGHSTLSIHSRSESSLYVEDSSVADDDDEDLWMADWVPCEELESKRRFFLNTATGAVAKDMRMAKQVSMNEDMRIATMSSLHVDDLDNLRRNSQIMSGAWDNSDDVKQSTLSLNTLSSDKSRRKDTVTETIPPVLKIIGAHLNNLSGLADLPPAIDDALRDMRLKVQEIEKVLEEEANNRDDRNDVEALLDLKKIKWDFNNAHVEAFRARASRFPHKQFQFKDWHMPSFTSQVPIPRTSSPIYCRLHMLLNGQIAEDDSVIATRIVIEENDTVVECIRKSFKKYNNRRAGDAPEVINEQNYCLKCVGFNEYLAGDLKLLDFEYVRTCLRNGHELELSVVPLPLPLPVPDDINVLADEYRSKVNKDVKVLSINDYANLRVDNPWDKQAAIPVNQVQIPLRIRLLGLENVDRAGFPRLDGTACELLVRCMLFHGERVIPESSLETLTVSSCRAPRWGQWLTFPNKYSDLPRETRLAIMVSRRVYDKTVDLLGFHVIQLVDEFGRFVSGRRKYNLWPMGVKEKEGDLSFLFRSTTRDNQGDSNAVSVSVEFDDFALPLVAPICDFLRPPSEGLLGNNITSIDKAMAKKLKPILAADSLYVMQPEEKSLIWMYRNTLLKNPTALPKFLQSVDWQNVEHRMECYRLLQAWAPPTNPVNVLELLDCKYADYRVREYAVNQLRKLADDELKLVLLQLTQCLKFEPYHDSPLTRFLISRALNSPHQIGHHFFWHLKAELQTLDFSERFGVILEEYLCHAGEHAKQLRKQNEAVIKLQRVAELVVKLKLEHKYSDQQCMVEYHKELNKLNRDFFRKMGSFQIPLNPRLEATTLIVEKCRYMSSKKIPLWLVFNNKDETAPPIYVIFKGGDDLRQDILTLQLLKIMDKLWLAEGLDMRLKPYRCIATGVNDDGEGVGMIEVVTNSDTTSGIQLKYGGMMGALNETTLQKFLDDNNPSPQQFEIARENFVRSCAGYCVATFVLGIGDRHNGNIMVTKDGHLFHIDFGHFLGNFKSKFGFNRERAAFVFTPEMAFVIGGKNYKSSKEFKSFTNHCCQAYNILRKHAKLLENMFMLMVSAGMPELMEVQDVNYLQEKLNLHLSDSDAEKAFKKELKKSLDTTWRRIDNMIHNVKHG